MARIASVGFGMQVTGMDTQPLDLSELQRDWGIRALSASFQEAVRDAAIVSLPVPANDATRHL
ncbi:MAG: hypothetical protein L3J02_03395, partial [Henriciella sp.]|nr:hypothetical protein [Henriciella sp.]